MQATRPISNALLYRQTPLVPVRAAIYLHASGWKYPNTAAQTLLVAARKLCILHSSPKPRLGIQIAAHLKQAGDASAFLAPPAATEFWTLEKHVIQESVIPERLAVLPAAKAVEPNPATQPATGLYTATVPPAETSAIIPAANAIIKAIATQQGFVAQQ